MPAAASYVQRDRDGCDVSASYIYNESNDDEDDDDDGDDEDNICLEDMGVHDHSLYQLMHEDPSACLVCGPGGSVRLA